MFIDGDRGAARGQHALPDVGESADAARRERLLWGGGGADRLEDHVGLLEPVTESDELAGFLQGSGDALRVAVEDFLARHVERALGVEAAFDADEGRAPHALGVRLLDRDREGVVGGGTVGVREHCDARPDAVHDLFPAFPLNIRVDGVHLQVAEVGDLRGAVGGDHKHGKPLVEGVAQQLGHTLRQVGSGHVGVRVGDQDDAVGGQRRLLAFIGGTGDEPEQDADDDAGRKESARERNILHTPQ